MAKKPLARRDPVNAFLSRQADRFFRIIKFWMDETSGISLKTGIPSYQVEDDEGRIHLLLHLPIEEETETAGASGGPDQAGLDSRSIFEGALVEE